MQDHIRDRAAALLAWYEAVGVDAVLAEEPIDWLARGEVPPGDAFSRALAAPAAKPQAKLQAKPQAEAPPLRRPVVEDARSGAPARPRPAASVPAPVPRAFTSTPPDAAETSARAAARAAASLDDLAEAIRRFDGCGLKATAKNTCVYRGAPRSRLALVGEAPGREEDLEGKPFVGRAGQLLDKMLAAIGLGEADVHITNIVYWRPPGNRTPTPQEALVCRPFLERQLELVAPDFVVMLGGAAAKHMFDVAEGIMRIRGKWREIDIGGRPVKAMATLHPAYLLRTPVAKRLAWRDLLAIRTALDAGQ